MGAALSTASILALALGGVGGTAGTGNPAVAVACRPLPAGCRCQIKADSASLNATIVSVNHAMDELTAVNFAQRALVRAARQAASDACDLDALKAALAAAQKASDESQKCVAPTLAAFNAATKKFNELTTTCAGHANEEPCKDELFDAFTKMNAASHAVASCQASGQTAATALKAAQKALNDATVKCAAAQAAVQVAERAERRAVRAQQGTVNGTFADEQAAASRYTNTLLQCGTQTNGTELVSLMRTHDSLVQRIFNGISAHFD